MRRKILYTVLFFGIIMSITSCDKLRFKEKGGDQIDDGERINIVETQNDISYVIDHMTLEQKVGQMIIGGINEDEVSENTKSFFEDNHIGGVILFSRNVKGRDPLKKFISELAPRDKNHGMFVSVDEEGGRVSRLPKGKITIPPNYELAKQNDSRIFFDIACVIGEELKSYGFNTDFAPVMDVWSNPKNGIIGNRAFSSDPQKVAECGAEMIKGFKSKGIISVIKHFPGHGDTLVDSHKGLPRIDTSLEELKARELIPFKDAIDKGVDGIMVGHLLLTQLGGEHPASLSKEIVTGLLREELGYNGVIFTDDMEMGAILNNYSIKEAVTLGVDAGIDVFLVCHNRSNIKGAIDVIIQRVKSGEIQMERIDKSVQRILKLKVEYGIVNIKEWRDTYEKTDNN